jgi:two-component system, sensor histidine kinase and response regulator
VSVGGGTGEQQASILVVDDSEIARASVTEILERRGYRVRSLASAFGVSAALASETPELILLDISMPGLRGDRLAEIVRRNFTFSCPIVFYSALDAAELGKLSVAAGVDGYICKSVSEQELVAAIAKHIAPRRAHARVAPEYQARERTLRLVIIDDNEFARDLFRHALVSQLRGCRVHVHMAAGVFDAWDLLQRLGGADLALVDEQLRGLRGSELVRRLRRDDRFRTMPIISLGSEGDCGEVEARAAGANEYLQKPFALNRMSGLVEGLLRTRAVATP